VEDLVKKLCRYPPIFDALLQYLDYEDLYMLAIFTGRECDLIALATTRRLEKCAKSTQGLKFGAEQRVDSGRLKSLTLQELFPEHCWLFYLFSRIPSIGKWKCPLHHLDFDEFDEECPECHYSTSSSSTPTVLAGYIKPVLAARTSDVKIKKIIFSPCYNYVCVITEFTSDSGLSVYKITRGPNGMACELIFSMPQIRGCSSLDASWNSRGNYLAVRVFALQYTYFDILKFFPSQNRFTKIADRIGLVKQPDCGIKGANIWLGESSFILTSHCKWWPSHYLRAEIEDQKNLTLQNLFDKEISKVGVGSLAEYSGAAVCKQGVLVHVEFCDLDCDFRSPTTCLHEHQTIVALDLIGRIKTKIMVPGFVIDFAFDGQEVVLIFREPAHYKFESENLEIAQEVIEPGTSNWMKISCSLKNPAERTEDEISCYPKEPFIYCASVKLAEKTWKLNCKWKGSGSRNLCFELEQKNFASQRPLSCSSPESNKARLLKALCIGIDLTISPRAVRFRCSVPKKRSTTHSMVGKNPQRCNQFWIPRYHTFSLRSPIVSNSNERYDSTDMGFVRSLPGGASVELRIPSEYAHRLRLKHPHRMAENVYSVSWADESKSREDLCECTNQRTRESVKFTPYRRFQCQKRKYYAMSDDEMTDSS
jgi:hypothetical protein